VTLAAACRQGQGGAPQGLGRRLAATEARVLSASADGAWLAYLDGCREARGQFLPPQTASCDLRVVAAAGGDPRKVASAVTTLPGALTWHPRAPILAALGEYDYLSGTGTLYLSADGGPGREVAEAVGFHGFAPGDDRVVAVAGGRIVSARPGEALEWMPGAEGLTSFELSPAWRAPPPGAVAALLRRPGRRGGLLLAQARDGKLREVSSAAGDYAFAPGGGAFAYTVQGPQGYDLEVVAGGGPPRVAGRSVRTFSFAPAGDAIAFVAGASPGKQGDLLAGPVGGPYQVMGREVGELSWARGAGRLAWLEGYDPRVRSGVAGAGGPGLRPRTFGKNVTDVEISPDGQAVAWLQHSTRGGYSVDLHLAPVEGEAPDAVVATGVFGFAFSPDSAHLYFRTRCVRNGEACDLVRVPAAGVVPGRTPEELAQGVKSFEFDPGAPGRILLGWQRTDRAALDIGVWELGKVVRVDTLVLPGSAALVPGRRRVAYVVVDPKRAGVYLADLPAP
jgi:hypothetical protein